jgi:hypothetical protein
MAFASGAVSAFVMHNKHHESNHNENSHHHHQHHHSTTSDNMNNNNNNADSIHCPSTSTQIHTGESTDFTNQTGAQMALNFIIKKVSAKAPLYLTKFVHYALQITKQKQYGVLLKDAIENDKREDRRKKRALLTNTISVSKMSTVTRPMPLVLTYEQARQLPKHVRATVQFDHLQRQVLLITWRKLTGMNIN